MGEFLDWKESIQKLLDGHWANNIFLHLHCHRSTWFYTAFVMGSKGKCHGTINLDQSWLGKWQSCIWGSGDHGLSWLQVLTRVELWPNQLAVSIRKWCVTWTSMWPTLAFKLTFSWVMATLAHLATSSSSQTCLASSACHSLSICSAKSTNNNSPPPESHSGCIRGWNTSKTLSMTFWMAGLCSIPKSSASSSYSACPDVC